MDILADQLTQARARGAVFSVLGRVSPWGLRFGGQRPLTAHVLTEGDGWLEQPGQDPVRIRARDLVLMTAGPPYALVSGPGAAAVPIADARQQGSDPAPGAGGGATILCGAYVLDGSVANALLCTLPRPVIVPADGQDPAFAAVVALLCSQIGRDAPGQQTVLDRLLDLTLVFGLRAWWARDDAAAPGWYRALADPGLRRVLEQVHAAPQRDWTVPGLGALAGMSRASFAARFHQVTGQSPGSYVTGVRMQRAEDALTRTNATLAQVAATVGYRNEYAFATAFRRQHGLAPGRWRTAQASQTR